MNNRRYVRFSPALIGALSICTSISGCGANVPFSIVPVHGKIAYQDGSLISADSILVTFYPILSGEKGKIVPPGGRTNVNVEDGTFSAVSSYRKDDGLAIGRHKVMVVTYKKGPNGPLAPSTAVPPVYGKETTTPLEIEVESGDQFLDLKISKK
jgi:hypothetical protein